MYAFLCLLLSLIHLVSTTDILGPPSLNRRLDCSSVHLSPADWASAGVDVKLGLWWNNTANPTAKQLASQFGPRPETFQCGIGAFSTCLAQSCQDYASDSGHLWAYYALNAVVNLNSFFNEIFTGVTNGQLDFVGLSASVGYDFFPWKEPEYLGNDFIIWIGAIITTVASFGILGPETFALSSAAAGAFITAAGQEITLSLSPQFTPGQGISELQALATTTGESTRAAMEQWANGTFNGQRDVNGHTLKDYLSGGLFMQSNYPSNQIVESFFREQLLARTINMGWRSSGAKVFIMAASASPTDSHGPNVTKYYSDYDQRVYYLYSYVEAGRYKGHLGKPPSFDKLNGSRYEVDPLDIVKSSARAWQYAKNNYTNQDVIDRIKASLGSNGSLTPFQDGTSWEGVWTIPVCDIGNRIEWITQFDDKKEGYGRLPCCCGHNCEDTADFVRAAGLKGFQTLIHGCKHQLKTDLINFNIIDYGFQEDTFPNIWKTWSKGRKAGFVIGLLLCVLVLYLVFACIFGSF